MKQRVRYIEAEQSALCLRAIREQVLGAVRAMADPVKARSRKRLKQTAHSDVKVVQRTV